jgi:hypothetical protein
MVSKYCRRGLEQDAGRTADKRLYWPAVETWAALYISSAGSGNPAAIRPEHWAIMEELRAKYERRYRRHI